MQTFVYDGSFCGYLSALAAVLQRKEGAEDIITQDRSEELLLGDFFHVASQPRQSEIFAGKIKAACAEAFNHTLNAFLAETPGCEMIACAYLRALFMYGRSVDSHMANPSVMTMIKLSNKVGGERHRMLGLLRFSETTDGIFYAPFEPDHNITPLVAGHFAARLPDRNWIIHDRRRGIAAVYRAQERRYEVVSGEISCETGFSEHELLYRQLWQHFHRTIAIKERTNPLLQRRCMPARYWKYLTEKQ